jgi:hypothetical protein
MRSFTFDVLERMSASGSSRNVEGSHWFNLARKLVREGRARLVQNNRVWCGYGGSRDVSYVRYTYTVTEKVN